jgi:hypothetical protein
LLVLPTPVTVNVRLPFFALVVTVTVRVDDPEPLGKTVTELRLGVIPVVVPVTLKEAVEGLNPPTGVTVTV